MSDFLWLILEALCEIDVLVWLFTTREGRLLLRILAMIVAASVVWGSG